MRQRRISEIKDVLFILGSLHKFISKIGLAVTWVLNKQTIKNTETITIVFYCNSILG